MKNSPRSINQSECCYSIIHHDFNTCSLFVQNHFPAEFSRSKKPPNTLELFCRGLPRSGECSHIYARNPVLCYHASILTIRSYTHVTITSFTNDNDAALGRLAPRPDRRLGNRPGHLRTRNGRAVSAGRTEPLHILHADY